MYVLFCCLGAGDETVALAGGGVFATGFAFLGNVILHIFVP